MYRKICSCFNNQKDPLEEYTDCGGRCRPCMWLDAITSYFSRGLLLLLALYIIIYIYAYLALTKNYKILLTLRTWHRTFRPVQLMKNIRNYDDLIIQFKNLHDEPYSAQDLSKHLSAQIRFYLSSVLKLRRMFSYQEFVDALYLPGRFNYFERRLLMILYDKMAYLDSGFSIEHNDLQQFLTMCISISKSLK